MLKRNPKVAPVAEASVTAFMEVCRQPVESALERSVDALASVAPRSVAAAVRDGVLGGGKRIRPLLLVAAYEEAGAVVEEPVYDLAASVEMIHAYSLMHDDLPCMDDAPLRRGSPTAHIVHGAGAATVAGVLLIPWAATRAYESSVALGRSENQARAVAVHLLEAAGAGGMIGGQALDLLGEGRSLDEHDLAELHTLKTGALLAAALEVGAMAAGAGRALLAALGSFGRDLGLAFQVTDDVLDATATEDVLGKRPSDAERDKSTYVALMGIEGARAHARRLVERALASLDGAGLSAFRLRELARFIVRRSR